MGAYVRACAGSCVCACDLRAWVLARVCACVCLSMCVCAEVCAHVSCIRVLMGRHVCNEYISISAGTILESA